MPLTRGGRLQRLAPGETGYRSPFKTQLRAAQAGGQDPIGDMNRNAQWKGTMGSGVPDLPTYTGMKSLGSEGIYTPSTLSGDEMNRLSSTGLTALTQRATGTGPSAWANMMASKQGVEELAAMDTASKTAAGQTQAARSMLARSGGLRGGAAERLASKGAEAELMARQGVTRQGMLDRANIGVEDERTRTELLKQLPGAELAAAQYKSGLDIFNRGAENEAGKFNVQNRLADLGAKNQFGQDIFGTQMAGYGAQQTAKGIAASAPKSGGGIAGQLGKAGSLGGRAVLGTVTGGLSEGFGAGKKAKWW